MRAALDATRSWSAMKSPKKRSARTERRAAERDARKRTHDRLRLATLEPGGRPDRPVEVESASVIEPSAAAAPCVACGGRVRVEDHAARTVDGVSLRVVRVRCPTCGLGRELFFRIVVALPS
jgi:hypothetical protein